MHAFASSLPVWSSRLLTPSHLSNFRFLMLKSKNISETFAKVAVQFLIMTKEGLIVLNSQILPKRPLMTRISFAILETTLLMKALLPKCQLLLIQRMQQLESWKRNQCHTIWLALLPPGVNSVLNLTLRPFRMQLRRLVGHRRFQAPQWKSLRRTSCNQLGSLPRPWRRCRRNGSKIYPLMTWSSTMTTSNSTMTSLLPLQILQQRSWCPWVSSCAACNRISVAQAV